MIELANLFPSLLLGAMIVLTLILLPVLHDDRYRRRDDEQRTDELHLGKSLDDRR